MFGFGPVGEQQYNDQRNDHIPEEGAEVVHEFGAGVEAVGVLDDKMDQADGPEDEEELFGFIFHWVS